MDRAHLAAVAPSAWRPASAARSAAPRAFPLQGAVMSPWSSLRRFASKHSRTFASRTSADATAAQPAPATCEPLEPRRLMAGVPAGNVYHQTNIVSDGAV